MYRGLIIWSISKNNHWDRANRPYYIDNANKFKMYRENSWGLTPCIGQKGYCGFGAKPCETDVNVEK